MVVDILECHILRSRDFIQSRITQRTALPCVRLVMTIIIISMLVAVVKLGVCFVIGVRSDRRRRSVGHGSARRRGSFDDGRPQEQLIHDRL